MPADRSLDVVEHRRRRLEPVPESARVARAEVLATLASVGLGDLADTATLLASELVTNAIVHARTPIVLDVFAGRGGVRVAVHDESSVLPSQRHYGETATTGRGMSLVEIMADRHGTQVNRDAAGDRSGVGSSASSINGRGAGSSARNVAGSSAESSAGKVVWFELGNAVLSAPIQDAPAQNTVIQDTPGQDAPVQVVAGQGAAAPGTSTPASGQDTADRDAPVVAVEASHLLQVRLESVPCALALAWQQHADTLLRECLLARWDDSATAPSGPGDVGAAHDAFAAVAAALEPLAAMEQPPPYADVPLSLTREVVAGFGDLDAVLEDALELAEIGQTLAPPTQPEIRSFRRWVVSEVREQAAGTSPTQWPGLPSDLAPSAGPLVDWDGTWVRQANTAVIAADDLNRIIAASPAALELLGWDDSLVGRRIVTVIPHRLRESHIAAFTLHLITGKTRIIGQEVTVPALRRDGTEVEVVLRLTTQTTADRRSVFIARLELPSQTGADGPSVL